ncbi:MAG: adenylate kinase [Clostridia bacterium]|nr:adenylate kinase [Clostridia bacterium]
MKLVLLGPPGAGKGTQAANLAKEYKIPAISTGHIIRTAISEKTPVGKIAEEFIKRGELVPDDTVVELVKVRLAEDDCKNGYILDGFPRTLAQAEIMDETSIGVDLVLDIDVPDEKLVERLSGRRECKKCGAAYHVLYNPTKNGETCDKCGGELVMRSDDVPEVILKRLEVYHKQTEPLKEYYTKQGKLTSIQGQKDLAETTRMVLDAVKEAGAKL